MNSNNSLNHATPADLSTRRVVILGGTGRVGEGLVRAWLSGGAQVIVPTRTAERGTEFKAHLAGIDITNLHLVVGDYTGFDSAQQMAQQITDTFGEVSDVLAAIGGWWQGKALWEVTEAEFQRYYVDLSTAHVANIRAWLPRLTEAGSYQLILGGSAGTPVPGASIINMEQAGLLMMHRVLSAEAGTQRRIFAHEMGPVATRERPWVDPQWVSNEELGLFTGRLAADSSRASAHHLLRTKDQLAHALEGN